MAGIGDRVLPAHGDRGEEARDELGVGGGEVGVHDDRVAIERQPVIGHQDGGDVALLGHAQAHEVEVGREREAGDGRDVALGQHRLAGREADRLDGDLRRVQSRAASAKAGNWAQAPSGGGAPSTLPSRSPGASTPSDLRPTMAKGGLS